MRVPGNARAFEHAPSRLWEFRSVAQPGSVGHDTREGDAEMRAVANAWPFYFTLDNSAGSLLPLARHPCGYVEIEKAQP